MKHFLITRFNLTVDVWNSTKNKMKVLDDEWLTDRFRLFENYCLPSLKNQKNQNFEWLVFFDTQTTDKFRQKVTSIAEEYKNFNPFYINGASALEDVFRNYVATKQQGEAFFITSRLDNDDMLHQDFTEVIQALAKPINKLVIDARVGFRMNTENNEVVIQKLHKKFNPFVSIVCEFKNFDFIYSKEHTNWAEVKSIKTYYGKALWMQLIHDYNKLNSFVNRFPTVKEIPASNFGIHRRALKSTGTYSFSEQIKLWVFDVKIFFKRIQYLLS